MATDNEARISIRADASGVKPGVEQTTADLGLIDARLGELNARFADFAAQINASMAQGSAGATEMAVALHAVEAETEKETLSLKEMALQTREGMEAMVEMKEALFGLGELMMAAFAIEEIKEWTEKMAEAAEKVKHVSEQLGITREQAQGLQVVAAGTGVSFDVLNKGMGMFARTVATATGQSNAQGKALAMMGVAANDGRNNLERLMVVADKFKEMAPGDRAAMSMALFSRSGRGMTPILIQGAPGCRS